MDKISLTQISLLKKLINVNINKIGRTWED